MDAKTTLLHYLTAAREALLWKLDGLTPYDARRPLVPSGTNLLGLVKHTASVEAGYLGAVFGRPFPEPLPWFEEDAEPNADMWASEDQTIADIVGLYGRVAEHSAANVAALDLDAPGRVPWWGDDGDVTLHLILVHLTAETHRHAGHADILREMIDGSVGLRRSSSNMPDENEAWWQRQHGRLEQVARDATA